MMLVLRDNRIYLDHKKYEDHHPLTGYFLPYPDTTYDGLVTTINKDNMLNWVYVDTETYQLKYGVRAEAQPQWTGPMTLIFTKDSELRLGFTGWEGFVAVEEDSGGWAVYFDKDDNALENKLKDKAVVEIEVIRAPLEWYKPTETRAGHDEPD